METQGILLLLLLVANGSPILARMALRGRYDAALDGGHRLADGRPMLGPSKTWRGLAAAVLLTTLCAALFGLSWWIGVMIGVLAMAGDAVSSFVKRRLGIPSGGMAIGLDHIPESLLPLLACRPLLGLGWIDILLLSLAFMVANLVMSRVLFHLGVREHPH